MKKTDPKDKNWKLITFIVGVGIVVLQTTLYITLYNRILDTEKRVYTDFHQLKIEVEKLRQGI